MKNITEQELSDELLIKINNKEQELPSDIKSQLADIMTDIENIDLNAEKVKLISDNFKTKNVKGALEELFTFGNNVKFNTVDSLLSLDKNLQISKESTWEDIIKNISKISTGKKWAAGTETLMLPYGANHELVSSLTFNPSLTIVVFHPNTSDIDCINVRWDNKIIMGNAVSNIGEVIHVGSCSYERSFNVLSSENKKNLGSVLCNWIAIE